MRTFRSLTGGRRAAVAAVLLLTGLGVAVTAAAQKPAPPPPEAVEALMHCAPWRPNDTPDRALAPPTEVRAARGGDVVQITWRDNADDETCFGVLRVLPPPIEPSSVEQVTLVIVTLANATAAGTVSPVADRACFAVYSGNAAGRSAPSNLACPEAPAPPPTPPRLSDALLAPNRGRLAVCVDGVGEAAAAVPEARARVERAIAVVARHPVFRQAGLDAAPPVVDEGCPHGPYLLEPDVFWENGIPITGAGRTVQEASIYRLFVFLLPPADLASVIHGHLNIRRTAEEMLCFGHQCWEVTSGIYLTPEESEDEPFLVTWLTKGLGLEPALPPGNAPALPGRRP